MSIGGLNRFTAFKGLNRFTRTGMLEAKDQAQVLSKKKKKKKVFTKIFQAISPKKKDLQKIFKRSPQKNVFQKIFQALHQILTIQKILLSSRRGQGLQNLSSTTPPLIISLYMKLSTCIFGEATPRGLGQTRKNFR